MLIRTPVFPSKVGATGGFTNVGLEVHEMVSTKLKSPETLLKSERELDCLYEISQSLVSSPNLHASVQRMMDTLAEKMGMRRGTLTLLKPETSELIIEIAHGMPEEKKRRGKYKVGEGITGKVFESGEPAVVPQIGNEPLFLNRTKWRGDITKQNISFLCVPIKIGENVIGTFSVDRLFDEGISFEEDLRLLTIIASMIAYAVKLNQMMEQEKAKWINERTKLQEELEERYNIVHLIGKSRPMEEVYRRISQVAKSNATVLIRGESGTGKELVAHAIHYNSQRATQPFIKVSCAALPEGLLETELFGHVKGAFTGAIANKKGRLESAHGGTLFLDEIGHMSLNLQAKLLRFLQEGTFEPVGGIEERNVDVRVITATNRDLTKEISDGRFLSDLLFRIEVISITLPPLRERGDDIFLLVNHFIKRFREAYGKNVDGISQEAMDALIHYPWPGNIRQLSNTVERAILLEDDTVIRKESVSLPEVDKAALRGTDSLGLKLSEAQEKELIQRALEDNLWIQKDAARQLGITPRALNYRIKKLGITHTRWRKNK